MIAEKIAEYGIAYCQYSYSLPRPVTEYFQVFMMVNYHDFFTALGFGMELYNSINKTFNAEEIIERIKSVEGKWRSKFLHLNFKTENLKFGSLAEFNLAFTSEIENLNLETK